MTVGWTVLPGRAWRLGRRLIGAGFGLDSRLDTEDRRLLEGTIIPFLVARPDIRTILFVGCDWYSRHYTRLFPGCELWTIEKDPLKRIYGGRRHVIGPLHTLERHFARDTFDLVVCNGVVGWGLDDPDEVESSFEACRRCLRPGGVLVLGWNDVPERTPFPLEECRALARFVPYRLEPLGVSRLLTATVNRHTFNFYRKAADPPPGPVADGRRSLA